MSDRIWNTWRSASAASGEIDGRDMEVSQIGYSLGSLLRESFPDNKVPLKIAEKHTAIVFDLEVMESRIQGLAEEVLAAMETK